MIVKLFLFTVLLILLYTFEAVLFGAYNFNTATSFKGTEHVIFISSDAFLP